MEQKVLLRRLNKINTIDNSGKYQKYRPGNIFPIQHFCATSKSSANGQDPGSSEEKVRKANAAAWE